MTSKIALPPHKPPQQNTHAKKKIYKNKKKHTQKQDFLKQLYWYTSFVKSPLLSKFFVLTKIRNLREYKQIWHIIVECGLSF